MGERVGDTQMGTTHLGDSPSPKYCQGKVKSEFPGQFLNKTVEQILELARRGDPAAQTARKILFKSDFAKYLR